MFFHNPIIYFHAIDSKVDILFIDIVNAIVVLVLYKSSGLFEIRVKPWVKVIWSKIYSS